MFTATTSVEELHALIDEQGRPYQMRLFEDDHAWTLKVFDDHALVAQVNCLVQGSDLFLADIHVFDAARHPLRRVQQFKGWLGFDVSGRTENYQHRGLGTELIKFVIRRARDRGLLRVTGRLFPKDLEANPRLPGWYRHQGFQVAMNESGTAGELELVLSDFEEEGCPPD
jgi:GNAT superfamily N-acetyltransferase